MKNPFKPNNSTTFSSPGHQSAGILDDYAIRKDIQTISINAQTYNNISASNISTEQLNLGITSSARINMLDNANNDYMRFYSSSGSLVYYVHDDSNATIHDFIGNGSDTAIRISTFVSGVGNPKLSISTGGNIVSSGNISGANISTNNLSLSGANNTIFYLSGSLLTPSILSQSGTCLLINEAVYNATNPTFNLKGTDTDNRNLARFYSNIGTRGSFIIQNGVGLNPSIYIGCAGSGETLAIGAASGIEIIRISSNGLVGIGTKVPSEALQVSGGNICVSGSGVFKKDGSLGVGGTFTTVDLKTVTVSGGIIISIV